MTMKKSPEEVIAQEIKFRMNEFKDIWIFDSLAVGIIESLSNNGYYIVEKLDRSAEQIFGLEDKPSHEEG